MQPPYDPQGQPPYQQSGPYYPPQGQPPYQPTGPYSQPTQSYYAPPPPQPGQMQQPPRKPRKRKNVAIGCGVLFALFLLIGSCNAILTHGQGIGNTDTSAATVAVTTTPSQTATIRQTQPAKKAPATAPKQAPAPTHSPAQVNQPPEPTATQPPALQQPPAPAAPPATTQSPAPTGVNGNPWGYDFTPGSTITNPPATFCDYFACVTTFWKDTSGYVVECGNGEYSHSGGVSGACSRDGSVSQILYSH